jgi:hypothetical protein
MKHVLSVALLACCAALAAAAPPSLEFPDVNRPENGYVVVQPKTDAVSVVYVALDGVYPIPSALLSDKRTFALPANGLADGEYKFMAVAAGKVGEQTSKLLTVTIGRGGTRPPPDDKKPADPKDPVTPATKFYFLVVRPDGNAAPAFTKAMNLPEWGQLRAAGHTVKEVTAKEAAAPEIGLPTDPAQLPAVFTLVVLPDKKGSALVRGAVPMPTSGPAILELPKGVR